MAAEFSFGLVSTSLTTAMKEMENSLATTVTGLTSGASLSPSALLGMQSNLQMWSTSISLMSSLNKEIGDTIKGIVQKF